MSCISPVSRGEDNGSDNEDKLDDGQQGRNPPCLSVPCGNGWSRAEELRIDQNQCRRLKYYYDLRRPQGFGVGTLTESRAKWDYGVGIHSTPMKWATARALVPWPLFIPQAPERNRLWI